MQPTPRPLRHERPLREDLVTKLCLSVEAVVRHEQGSIARTLEEVLRRERKLSSRERRAVAERSYALLRRRRHVDYVAERLLPGFAGLAVTRQGLWRLAISGVLEGEQPEAVARALQFAPPDVALLGRTREAGRGLDKLPQRERLAITASLTDFFAGMLIDEYGDGAEALAAAMNQRAPLTIRANRLKGTREELQRRLAEEGVATSATKLAPDGLILETGVNVFGLQSFQEGRFEVQDEGSQLLGLLVDPPPKLVVDLCAGTGGKALQLAAAMHNRGELYALDVSAQRLDELKKRARRAGAHNIRVRALPAEEVIHSDLVGRAERVLVDAPCSGSGTLRRRPGERYQFDAKLLEEQVQRQRRILAAAAALVKPGGRLIYGTCSLFSAENEKVVGHFLAANPEFALQPSDAQSPLRGGDGFLRLYPHRENTDGFFGAVLVRHDEKIARKPST